MSDLVFTLLIIAAGLILAPALITGVVWICLAVGGLLALVAGLVAAPFIAVSDRRRAQVRKRIAARSKS